MRSGPGDRTSAGEFHVTIPHAQRTTHEQHFAKVLDQFLNRIDGGESSDTGGRDLVAKYTLLARAADCPPQRLTAAARLPGRPATRGVLAVLPSTRIGSVAHVESGHSLLNFVLFYPAPWG
jgi:hypothetical protein